MKKRSKDIGVGDVVVLKSGGPAMVVSVIIEATAGCYWQVNGQHPFYTNMPLVCLAIYEE